MYLIERIKELMAKIESRSERKPAWQPFKAATSQKRNLSMDRQNHGRKTPKKRRQMAARSNRINRRRISRWKY